MHKLFQKTKNYTEKRFADRSNMKKAILYVGLILNVLGFSACAIVPKTPSELEVEIGIEINESIKDRYGLPKFQHFQKCQGYGEVMTANGYQQMFMRAFDANDDAPPMQTQDLGIDVIEYGQPLKFKDGDMEIIPLIRIYDKNFDGQADIIFFLINDEPRDPKYLRRNVTEPLDMKIKNFIKFNPTFYHGSDKRNNSSNKQLIKYYDYY